MGTEIIPPLDVIVDLYRTCEFATRSADGTPVAWPTVAHRQGDGTLLLTTSIAFAQKAHNVRRDSRVGLLFSDPTGSDRIDLPQIYIQGVASCPDEIRTAPDGVEGYWRVLFERQPHTVKFTRFPLRWMMDWYYMRLLITVTPIKIEVRPPLPAILPQNRRSDRGGDGVVPGAAQVASFPSAVLSVLDASGTPLLLRTQPQVGKTGFTVDIDNEFGILPGRASLLVHRHDEQLNSLRSALVVGKIHNSRDGWQFVSRKVVEPAASERKLETCRTLVNARRAAARYLKRRNLPRPDIEWKEFQKLIS